MSYETILQTVGNEERQLRLSVATNGLIQVQAEYEDGEKVCVPIDGHTLIEAIEDLLAN